MEVIELNHPLVTHKLTILRNKKTGTKEFRDNKWIINNSLLWSNERCTVRGKRNRNSNMQNER